MYHLICSYNFVLIGLILSYKGEDNFVSERIFASKERLWISIIVDTITNAILQRFCNFNTSLKLPSITIHSRCPLF